VHVHVVTVSGRVFGEKRSHIREAAHVGFVVLQEDIYTIQVFSISVWISSSQGAVANVSPLGILVRVPLVCPESALLALARPVEGFGGNAVEMFHF
jgi:hypothetical protein